MSLRVGIGLFTAQLPSGSARSFALEYAETLELVRLAEQVGFESAWVSEHHGSSDGYLPSLLPMLAAFAAVTERIELGTGVVLTPLHDPLRLAEDAAVVDQLSAGRLILGLGNGSREEEFRMFGLTMNDRGLRTGNRYRAGSQAIVVPLPLCLEWLTVRVRHRLHGWRRSRLLDAPRRLEHTRSR